MYGPEGGGQFPDFAPIRKAVTNLGSLITSSTQEKWAGLGSGFFGASKYLTTPHHADFNITDQNFGISCWYYPTARPGAGVYPSIIAKAAGYQNQESFDWILEQTTGILYFQYATNGSNTTFRFTTQSQLPTLNAWNYLTLQRNGAAINQALGGVFCTQESMGTDSIYSSAQVVTVGKQPGVAQYLPGYLCDLQMWKGVRYTGNFTPPVAPSIEHVFPDQRVSVASPSLSGNAIRFEDGRVDAVLITSDDTARRVVAAVLPEVGGAWSADVPPGSYYISYVAGGYVAEIYGPYEVV